MRHPLLRLAPLFRPHLGLLGASMGGLLLASGLTLALPWIVARAIDTYIEQADRTGLMWCAAAYFGVLLSTLLMRYGSRIGIEIVAQQAMVALKKKLFGHLIDHDLAFHDDRTSGRLITRVQGDPESLRVLFTEVILATPADVLMFIGVFTVIGISAPDMMLPVFSVVPPYILAFVVFRKYGPPRFLALRKEKAQLTGFLTEALRAVPTLRRFDQLDWADARAEAHNRSVFHAQVQSGLMGVYYFNAVFMTRTLGYTFLLFYGAHRVADGTVSVGALVMAMGYMRQLFNPLMRLSHQLSTLETARAAAIRVADILDTPREIVDPEEPVEWPGVRDGIRLEGVGFHYHEGTQVLHDVDLEVGVGQRVGIVGATGSGKSTVLNLLLRFRDPVSGRVTIDGVDLRDMRVDDIRRHVGLVLQDVHLFRGTVLENLGGDADKAQRALDTLGVDISLERPLNDGASDLSRGERQLLTFARALVEDPEILVLDEATSAVDPATEARLQAALEQLQAGRTTIMVAHRLSTVRDCDQIFVLSAGSVVESGNHHELLDRNGLYAALAHLQQGAAA